MVDRSYHHGSLEQALADAAVTVVDRAGMQAMSLRELARTVGVSPSAAYRHFPSREHLVCRVSQMARQRLGQDLLKARDDASTARNAKRRSIDQFQAIGNRYVTFALEHPLLFEAAFVRCAIRPPSADSPDPWAILVETVEQLISSGVVPPERRADGPLIAWAGVHGLSQILTASVWPDGLSVDHHINAVVEAITRSLH